MIYLGVLVFLFGLFIIVRRFSHLLRVLIGLEFVVLGVVICSISIVGGNLIFVLLILCVAVCEARVGLALLVKIVRLYGRDSCDSFLVKF